MSVQLSQDYDVDSRYSAGAGASDNSSAKSFLERFLNKMGAQADLGEDQQPEDRFIMSGPGDTVYGFRNEFRASK